MQWVVENYPCYICNIEGNLNYYQIDFHHLRGKYAKGMAIRDDSVGIPICRTHHYHITFQRGERLFWEELNIDPKVYADELYQEWKEINEYKKLWKVGFTPNVP